MKSIKKLPSSSSGEPDKEVEDIEKQIKSLANTPILWDERYIIRTNKQGVLEKVDIDTGTIEELETDGLGAYGTTYFDPDNFYSFEDPATKQTILVPKKLKGDPSLGGRLRISNPYNPIVANRVIERIYNGETLVSITDEPEMPSYYDLVRWRKEDVKFDEAVRTAIKGRSEYYAEKIVESSMTTIADKEEINLAKLRNSALQWAAEVHHPERFTQKGRDKGTSPTNVQVVVNTGFKEDKDQTVVNLIDETQTREYECERPEDTSKP